MKRPGGGNPPTPHEPFPAPWPGPPNLTALAQTVIDRVLFAALALAAVAGIDPLWTWWT